MPHIQWEWKIGPQTMISAAMLAAMVIGGIKFFFDVETDVRLGQVQVSFLQTQNTELRTAVTALLQSQIQTTGELANTKAKVDVILPTVQRIEDFLLRRGELAKPDLHR